MARFRNVDVIVVLYEVIHLDNIVDLKHVSVVHDDIVCVLLVLVAHPSFQTRR